MPSKRETLLIAICNQHRKHVTVGDLRRALEKETGFRLLCLDDQSGYGNVNVTLFGGKNNRAWLRNPDTRCGDFYAKLNVK